MGWWAILGIIGVMVYGYEDKGWEGQLYHFDLCTISMLAKCHLDFTWMANPEPSVVSMITILIN